VTLHQFSSTGLAVSYRKPKSSSRQVKVKKELNLGPVTKNSLP